MCFLHAHHGRAFLDAHDNISLPNSPPPIWQTLSYVPQKTVTTFSLFVMQSHIDPDGSLTPATVGSMFADNSNQDSQCYLSDGAIHDVLWIAFTIPMKIASHLGDFLSWQSPFHNLRLSSRGLRLWRDLFSATGPVNPGLLANVNIVR
jgi:hypothetical protein